MKHVGWLAAVLGVLYSLPTAAQEWSYHDPGDLISGSGAGREDWTVYAAGMRFPMESGPAFPNSQVYNPGGYLGPAGGQCSAVNYNYPWRDNYCEERSWNMPLCPSGNGHQGQDIRPATCQKSVHWNVATEAGTVTNIGSYSVYVTAPDGTRHDYLHGDSIVVSSGQSLERAQRINRVSTQFGGTPTTIHLHYNIRQDVAGVGSVYVPPYLSLVESYEKLMGLGNIDPTGALLQAGCDAIVGWAFDEDVPDAAVNVRVAFGAPAEDPMATIVELAADRYDDAVCEQAESCEHAFSLEVPLSLRDDEPHQVYVYAEDDDGGGYVEVSDPMDYFSCPLPDLPSGERRLVSGPEAIASWGLSPFWDMARIDDATLQGYPEGQGWEDEPLLVQSEGATSGLWLIDGGQRRLVSEVAAENWELSSVTPTSWPEATLVALPVGPSLRDKPWMISSDGVTIYVIDDRLCSVDDPACADAEPGQGEGIGADGVAGSGVVANGGLTASGDIEVMSAVHGDRSGCGCRTAPGEDPAGLALLALTLLGLRRRRAT